MHWTEQEDKKLFNLFNNLGAQWVEIAKSFTNRTPNQVKNRFYSTLRRVAIKKNEQSRGTAPIQLHSKNFLLRYIDDAIEMGHGCKSKRGRKKKAAVKYPAAAKSEEIIGENLINIKQALPPLPLAEVFMKQQPAAPEASEKAITASILLQPHDNLTPTSATPFCLDQNFPRISWTTGFPFPPAQIIPVVQRPTFIQQPIYYSLPINLYEARFGCL